MTLTSPNSIIVCLKHHFLAKWTLLDLAGTLVSYFDVITQSTNRKVFWAVGALLPDALVNFSDVAIQISLSKEFGTVGAFLPDALVNSFDVDNQMSGFEML